MAFSFHVDHGGPAAGADAKSAESPLADPRALQMENQLLRGELQETQEQLRQVREMLRQLQK